MSWTDKDRWKSWDGREIEEQTGYRDMMLMGHHSYACDTKSKGCAKVCHTFWSYCHSSSLGTHTMNLITVATPTVSQHKNFFLHKILVQLIPTLSEVIDTSSCWTSTYLRILIFLLSKCLPSITITPYIHVQNRKRILCAYDLRAAKNHWNLSSRLQIRPWELASSLKI